MLSVAIGVLRPPVVREVSEAAGVSADLRTLARNADPAVRAQSLVMLAEWDRSPAVEESLYHGLQDLDPRVKDAAMQAMTHGVAARSERIKASLLNVLQNPNASEELRASALNAISGFTLQGVEYEFVNRALAQMVAAQNQTLQSAQ